jgi:hypothetical protein
MPNQINDSGKPDRLKKLSILTQKAFKQVDVLYRINQNLKRSAQFSEILSGLPKEALAAISFISIGVIVSLSTLPIIQGLSLSPLYGIAAGATGLLILRYLPKTEEERFELLEKRMQRLKKLEDAELLDITREQYKQLLESEIQNSKLLPPIKDQENK